MVAVLESKVLYQVQLSLAGGGGAVARAVAAVVLMGR